MNKKNPVDSETVTPDDCFQVLKEFMEAEKTQAKGLPPKRGQPKKCLEFLGKLEKLHKKKRKELADTLLERLHMTETNATNPQCKTFNKSLTVLNKFFKAVGGGVSPTKIDEAAKCLEQMERIHDEIVDYYNGYVRGINCEKIRKAL